MNVEAFSAVEVLVGKESLLPGRFGRRLLTASSLVKCISSDTPQPEQKLLDWREDGIDDHKTNDLGPNVAEPVLVEIVVDAAQDCGDVFDLDFHG